ncbi:uncharacterized protein AMSG_11165 [Thecamonas trahens ATCC 50062]|uniref:Pentacotripeptide-repeat region of PRORP domain-containing protein n=1 Tax=Thecamonas trahens ATCC 50062 TaxID=461836 RepID=A0A0L0DW15_THETB|nr:hypothetical protein AMSG_11165 [Thecamonas trahens ATCC 50062]KNC55708.1 hypothetical protein AMSG_11165 [Thecamonas trahens ATCC 50062]|eukprot:XP_013752919.1 hypothetical protein AMSG_11165 [Thecamonas trahens ATCC 50062]
MNRFTNSATTSATLPIGAYDMASQLEYAQALEHHGGVGDAEAADDAVDHVALIKERVAAGDVAGAEDMVGRLLPAMGITPHVVAFNIVMDGYAQAGRAEDALGVLELMETAGVAPTVVSLTTLAAAYIAAGEPQCAADVVNITMPSLGIAPNTATYGLMIKAAMAERKVDVALSWLDAMEASGVPGDATAYGTAINASANASDAHTAEAILARMLASGLVPDVIAWSALAKAHVRARSPAAASQVLDRMLAAGVAPNAKTYGTIIAGYAAARQPERAEALMDELLAAGLTPDVVTFTSLMEAHARVGDVSAAEHTLARITAAGLTPNIYAFVTLIKAHRNNHASSPAARAEGAEAVWAAMAAAKLKPSPQAYCVMLRTFANAKPVRVARITRYVDAAITDGCLNHHVASAALWASYHARDIALGTRVHNALLDVCGDDDEKTAHVWRLIQDPIRRRCRYGSRCGRFDCAFDHTASSSSSSSSSAPRSDGVVALMQLPPSLFGDRTNAAGR